jgi:hypothetical protein
MVTKPPAELPRATQLAPQVEGKLFRHVDQIDFEPLVLDRFAEALLFKMLKPSA